MAGEPNITVVGNLTEDPELKFTPSGAAVANFRVAVNSRTFDRQANEWKEGDTAFYRCGAWRHLAAYVAGSTEKGDRVMVNGRRRVRDCERQGGSLGETADINVDEVGPSLRFATASVTRMNRSSDGGGFGGGGQSAASSPWGGQAAQESAGDAWGGGSGEEPPF